MPLYAVVGLLELLWHWTAEQCPSGNIGKFNDAAIADAVSWPIEIDPAGLINALLECRLVDRNDSHRLIIHNWSLHADKAVHTKLQRWAENFADGFAPFERIRRTPKNNPEGPTGGGVSTESDSVITPCLQNETPRARAWPEPVPEPVPEPDGGASSADSVSVAVRKTPPAPSPLDGLEFEPLILELMGVHPKRGSIPLSRLAVREQYARYGGGDFEQFCDRLRSAHAIQRIIWQRDPKLRVRELQYWFTDGDWRVSGEISIVPPAASPAKVCEVCSGKTLVLDAQGYGLYCPGCGGADGGKILFEPGEATAVAEGLRTWHRGDDAITVIQRGAMAVGT